MVGVRGIEATEFEGGAAVVEGQIHPAGGGVFGKDVGDGGKVDQVQGAEARGTPAVRVAIDEGFDLRMALKDGDEAVGIEEAGNVGERELGVVMETDEGVAVRALREGFIEPLELGSAQFAGGAAEGVKGIEQIEIGLGEGIALDEMAGKGR